IPLMFQAGYLTIRSADPRTGRYTLAVPNAEVRYGLEEGLLPAWAPGYDAARGTDIFSLLDLVEAGDTEGMRDVLAALFASIPYTRAEDPFENYFQAVIWLVFSLLGRYVHTEVRQARGRADVVVEARAHVYVMELKRDGTAAEALAQIEGRGYAAPFSADPRELHLVGAAFDSNTRLLADWEEA
ncbi:MAG: PD-(D/E)XK nuclease domain-containing protein, partial [Atopobiaceae bacterium]|nr:PD-(D/E)XK nuclease domain-containing protein [Atopobiaceae bacterium]